MARSWRLLTSVFVALVIGFCFTILLPATNTANAMLDGEPVQPDNGSNDTLGVPKSVDTSLNASEQLLLSIDGDGSSVANSQYKDIGSIITVIIRILIVGAGVCFMLLVLLAGYKLVFAGDKEKQLSSAKSNFMTGLTGLIVLAAAWWIVQLLSNVLNMKVPGIG